MGKIMITPGTYRHFKGTLYEVICVAKHTEGDYELAIYTERGSGKYWARPVGMFNETVIFNGQQVQRFTKVKE